MIAYIFTFFLSFLPIQEPQLSIQNSYKEFYEIIDKMERDNPKAFPYINLLIKKAKTEKKYWELYYAYSIGAAFASKDLTLFYADSCVWAALHTRDSALLGNAYLTKGLRINGKRRYAQALENYLIADKYLENSNDIYAKHKLLFAIGQIKNYLGLFHEAIPMIDSVNRYHEKFENYNDSSSYLYSLNALKDMHVQLANYQKATEMYHRAKMVNIGLKDITLDALIDLYEGFNQYKQKNYSKALNLLEKSRPTLQRFNDFSRTAMADYYLGMCYFEMGNPKEGIEYLKKMDSVFVKENYTRPRFEKAYITLIQYYKDNNKPNEQLWAMEQLLSVRETLNTYFKGLSTKLKSDYDTKSLIKEKTNLKNSLAYKKSYNSILIIGIISISLFFGLLISYTYIRQRKYKSLYDKLLVKNSNKVEKIELPKKTLKKNAKKSTLSEKITEELSAKIIEFEEDKKYLNSNLSQRLMAKQLDTNTSYLSQFINQEKQMSFGDYINNLRITHLIKLLETEPKYRKYSLESLAEISGYKNRKTFNIAFKEATQISATYFLNRLVKEAV